MKKLLVVEDEKMIRRGICTIVKRTGVPIEEVLEAGNGLEALEILKNEKVDVVFTDIRMPKMDGIELVHEIQNLEERPFVVAISGYDDFSYAVEMLRNGVKEYILKPVDREKIGEVLRNLEEEISSQNAEKENEAEFGKQQLRYLITNEPGSKDEITAIKNKFDDAFIKGEYVVCCVSSKEIVECSEDIIELSHVGDYNVYIIPEPLLVDFMEQELTDVVAGISKTNVGIENLREAYKEATNARKKAFCLGKTVLAGAKEKVFAPTIIEDAQSLLENQAMSHRLQLIGTGKTEELISKWEKLFVAVERGYIKEEYFEAVQEKFIEEAIRTYRTSIDEEEMAKLQEFRHMVRFSSIIEYKECLMNWIIALHDKINNQDEVSISDQKMKIAMDFIKENYNTDINMAVVSNLVSMNYSLFSFSFKQYTGTNFVNYLKDLRVQEAKRMLAETDMKVIEISQSVGYDNEKHFMKLFKSYCGVSPTEYRKNMLRSQD